MRRQLHTDFSNVLRFVRIVILASSPTSHAHARISWCKLVWMHHNCGHCATSSRSSGGLGARLEAVGHV